MHGNSIEFKPDYEPSKGHYYKKIDEIVGNNRESEEILERLVNSDVLRKKFYEMIIVCPKCESFNIVLRYLCISCGSPQIDRQTLIEHMKCGVIDSFDHFQKNGKLFCLRCNKELSKEDKDLKNIGSWFHCSSCDSRFDEPKIVQRCMKCSQEFSIRDSNLKSLFSYEINKDVFTEYENEIVILTNLKPKLEKLGYKVEVSGKIEGESGTLHKFDIIAQKGKKPIVIDIIKDSKAIDTAKISPTLAKIFDIKSERQILIAIPRFDEESKKFARSRKIETIEDANIIDVVDKIISLLE